MAGHASVEDDDAALVRLLPSGALDPSFGRGGKVVLPLGALASRFTALSAQDDGGMLAGGEARDVETVRGVLVRLSAEGRKDPGFGDDGCVKTSLGEGGTHLRALTVRPDRKIFVAGSSGVDTRTFVVARFR